VQSYENGAWPITGGETGIVATVAAVAAATTTVAVKELQLLRIQTKAKTVKKATSIMVMVIATIEGEVWVAVR
jgi:hypothetical protein